MEAIRANWQNAPDVVVVSDLQDPRVPKRVRDYDAQQRSQGAAGEPEGFMFGGKVYIVASQVSTGADVQRVLFHEALGHAGLRGVFGKDLDKVLNQIVLARRAEVIARARQYGLHGDGITADSTNRQVWDSMSREQRHHAAEEVLAFMAQERPQLGFVKRAIAAIRTWLRSNGFDVRVSDAEIIRNFILPARRFIESGAGEVSGQPAFARSFALLDLARMARERGNENRTVRIADVSAEQVALLQKEGVPVQEGFTHTTDMFAVRHTLNRHGGSDAENNRGQIALQDSDIATIPEVIATPDALVLGAKAPRGQDVVGYLKRVPDGNTLYMEEVRTGRRTLAMVSMRKYPGTTDFETIRNRIVPSYAQSDTGDVRIINVNPKPDQAALSRQQDSSDRPGRPAFPSKAAKRAFEMGRKDWEANDRERPGYSFYVDQPGNPERDALMSRNDPVESAFYESGARGAEAPRLTTGHRRGGIPADGVSTNHVEGGLEMGVSMARVEGVDYQFYPMGGLVNVPETAYQGWLLDPDEFWGSDGEPLMVGLRPLDSASQAQSKDGGAPLFSRQDQDFDQPAAYAFNESDYRESVVSWAKERFGDAVAPNGKPAWQNFVRWFGESKVVDAEGRPLVVYHGTNDDFTSFDPGNLGRATGARSAKMGFFLLRRQGLRITTPLETQGSGIFASAQRRRGASRGMVR